MNQPQWPYYVRPSATATTEPERPIFSRLNELRILDPAVGTGHFLIRAINYLYPLYLEEAQHKGQVDHPDYQPEAILQQILSNNLHGLDLDPQAIQIGGIAMLLKARQKYPSLKAQALNLRATNPQGTAPKDYLGSLLKSSEILKEGTYDIVLGNPPYQATGKLTDATYIEANYPLGKADLYAAFLLRGLELVREGGISAMPTMRGWLFTRQFAELRKLQNSLLRQYLRCG